MKRVVFLVPLLSLCGCGGSVVSGELTGKISFKGVPLEEGTITVLAADAKSYQQVVTAAANGTYAFKALPVGEARITVIGPDSLQEPGTFVDKEPPGGDPERIALLKQAAAARAAQRKTRQPISYIYRKAETSPLKVTINPGPNTHDIELR